MKNPIIRRFIWILSGCPTYFFAAAIGGAIAAVGAVAGAAISASSSKSAAKKQGQATEAGRKLAGKNAAEANKLADIRYDEGKKYLGLGLTEANSYLSPYSNIGELSGRQLQAGTQAAKNAIAAKSPAEQALAKKQFLQYQSVADKLKPKGPSGAKPPFLFSASTSKDPLWNKVLSQVRASYAQSGKRLPQRLGRDRASLAAYQQATGLYNQALAKDAGVSDKKYKQAQAKADQLKQAWLSSRGAKEVKEGELVRKFSALDYARDPTTGGKRPPDLTKNFDQAQYLKKFGKKEADLGRDFDRKAFLKQGGYTEGGLFKKFGTEDFQVDPGYQFVMDEGNKAVNNSAAAQGGLLSGSTLKAIQKYSQGLGAQQYDNSFDRYQRSQQMAQSALGSAQGQFGANRANLQGLSDTGFSRFGLDRANSAAVYGDAYGRFNADQLNKYNKLKGLMDAGQAAATNQGQWTQNTAGNLATMAQNNAALKGANLTETAANQGEFMLQGANAQAAGQVGASNAINDGLGQVANIAGSYYSNKGQGNPSNYNPDTGNSITSASNYNPNYQNLLMPKFNSTNYTGK